MSSCRSVAPRTLVVRAFGARGLAAPYHDVQVYHCHGGSAAIGNSAVCERQFDQQMYDSHTQCEDMLKLTATGCRNEFRNQSSDEHANSHERRAASQ